MPKKLRFYYLFLLTLIRRQWRKILSISLLFVSLILIGGVFTSVINSTTRSTARKFIKPTYIEALVGNPSTFNPVFSKAESEKEINKLVFRGLTKLSTEGTIEGDLAEKIEIKTSTEYVFYLKRDIFWHDGRKFSADDVIHTVSISQNPLYQSEIADNFKDVEVQKKGDYIVVFRLKEPFAPFISATTVGIIPKHIPLTDYRPIGTGKFKFVAIENQSATLESEQIRIVFKYYPNELTAQTAFKLGEVHGLTSFNKLENLNSWKNFERKVSYLPYRLVTAFFNTKDEFLKEKPLRQALAYATPKTQVVQSQQGTKGKVAINSLPGIDSVQNGFKERYEFNLERASTLLNNSGWELKDGDRLKGGKKLKISITTLADKEYEDTAKKLKDSWEKLGIEVEVIIVSGTELRDQIVPNRTFSVLLSSQLLNPDPDQYVLWHTTQTQDSNITGIATPKLDKLLEDGRRSLDQKIRNEKYQEFQRLLLDESPAVFLYYPNFVWAHSKRVNKIDLSTFKEPQDRFDSSDNWEIERPLI